MPAAIMTLLLGNARGSLQIDDPRGKPATPGLTSASSADRITYAGHGATGSSLWAVTHKVTLALREALS
jgi:hypothetical protein